MSLLAKLRASTTFRDKPTRTNKRDPRQSFAKAAAKQIVNLKAGVRHHRWFDVNDDGEVLITPRNGVVALPISETGKNWAVLPNVEMAVAFIEQCVQVSEAGEFDEMFAATAKKKAVQA